MSPQNAVVIMEYVGKRTLLSLINDHPEALTEQFQAKCFRYFVQCTCDVYPP